MRKNTDNSKSLTKERFKLAVTTCEVYCKGNFEACIELSGRLHIASGKSEQEAKDNLWEYLTSDIGII